MGKGEIARYEQFLLFPQCFLKACFPGASKGVIVWEWVKTRKDMNNASCRRDMTEILLEAGKSPFKNIGEVIRPLTVVSLKGRLPQKLQSKSTFSCEIVHIHSLFRHSFIKKPKSKFNRNGK